MTPENVSEKSPRTFLIESAQVGRLDKVITEALVGQEGALSRTQVQRAIEQGNVRVNGRIAARAGFETEGGERIEIELPKVLSSTLEPIDLPLDVIFEDSEILVLNKPANLTVHPGAGNKTWTLAHALVSHLKGSSVERMGIVHRLDKDTTGAMVIAKTESALRSLQAQFAKRQASRTYYALAITTPRRNRLLDSEDSGVISAPIGRHPMFRTKMAILDSGRPAVTHWKILERFPYASLVQLNLESGRTHQIRVHLESVHAPVIGDKTYGDFSALPKDLREAFLSFGRQALHASKLKLVHPKSGEVMEFEAPMSTDMVALIETFRKRKAA